MKHRFTIVKPIPASMSNVIANYLDVEHLCAVHKTLSGFEVISETSLAACFILKSKILGCIYTNVHYYEYRPPNVIVQSVKSPLGPMTVVSTVRQTAPYVSVVQVETEIDLARWAYPFRGVVEAILRSSNRRILGEDLEILTRRTALFGDYVEDYLRPSQPLLFKEAFRQVFSKRSATST